MGPKKGIKMDLGSFLADDQFGGSWADDEVDYASISVPEKTQPRFDDAPASEPFGRSGDSQRRDYKEREQRERKEFPIPDAPPYKAKVSNAPWDITEQTLASWFVRGLLCKSEDIVEVSIPKDITNDRPKGFAFVEFNSRALLEDSLNLSGTSLNDRRVFVNVAAPPREDPFSMDWRSVRSGPLPGREERGSRPEVDWSSGRSGPLPPREFRERKPDVDWSSGRSGPLPPREQREPREPREPRPEVDWSSGRSGPLPPREQRERKPKQEFDWSSGRSGPLPSREQRERKPKQEFDWSSSRSGPLPPREFKERKPKQRHQQQDNLDWGAARTGPLPPRERKERKSSTSSKLTEETKTENEKTKRPNFNVLAVEGEEEKDEVEEEQVPVESKKDDEQTKLEKATANLSVNEPVTEGWEVVNKK